MCTYILSNDISENTQKKILSVCERYNAKLEIVATDGVRQQLLSKSTKFNFNISSFLRILIPSFLPNIDKALFIDSDTLVMNGIKKLYDEELGNNLLAMSLDIPIYRELQHEAELKLDEEYYNCGVMLINLKQWRIEKVQNKILDYYYLKGGHFAVDDQSVINACVSKRTLTIDYMYNAMQLLFSWSYKRFCKNCLPVGWKTKEEYRRAQKTPVIIHFNGPSPRPWEKWNSHPYTKLYRKYLYELYPDFELKDSKSPLWYNIIRYIKQQTVNKLAILLNLDI